MYLREDAPTLVRESKEGLSRVREIVVDLRDFSRIDSSHAWEWVDLHRTIESTLNIVGKEVRYHAELVRSFGELPMVRCIPSQVGQVIMNLVINAAHACASVAASSGRAGETVVVRTGRVEGEEAVWIEVEDTGCGIPEENLGRIFDRFFTYRPDHPTTHRHTGLGLSIVKAIVEGYGGNVSAANREAGGAVFEVRIPVSS